MFAKLCVLGIFSCPFLDFFVYLLIKAVDVPPVTTGFRLQPPFLFFLKHYGHKRAAVNNTSYWPLYNKALPLSSGVNIETFKRNVKGCISFLLLDRWKCWM